MPLKTSFNVRPKESPESGKISNLALSETLSQ